MLHFKCKIVTNKAWCVGHASTNIKNLNTICEWWSATRSPHSSQKYMKIQNHINFEVKYARFARAIKKIDNTTTSYYDY